MSSQLGTILWSKRRIAARQIAALRGQSKLKVAFVSISAIALWWGAYALFHSAFGWLDAFGAPIGDRALTELVLARLLSTFALVLMVMLFVSNVLIVYATFYRAREMGYLLRTPVPITTLFLGRFSECVTLSSWASAFLGSPLLIAYGQARQAPPAFYLALLAFFLPYVVIPAALGAIATLLAVPFAGRLGSGPRRFFAIGGGLALLIAIRASLILPATQDGLSLATLVRALNRGQSPWLPSVWLSRGVLDAAAGRFAESLLSLFWLVAAATILTGLATWTAKHRLYPGWALIAAGAGISGAHRGGLLTPFDRLLRVLPQPARALVSKDLRMFWRDPAQWTQFLLFFGILVLYVANLRRSTAVYAFEPWRSWIAVLNIAACLLVLATLTTRFVFPLISLEGRRFWILGLAPLERRQVVWQKFWLSVAGTSVFTLALAAISAWQLRLAPLPFALSVGAVAAATTALSGLAVGLGSLYPQLDEDNPARIVSGLGGTLSFLLSMAYVAVVTTILAVVLHAPRMAPLLGLSGQPSLAAVAALLIVVTSAAAALIPMRLGVRNLERIEL